MKPRRSRPFSLLPIVEAFRRARRVCSVKLERHRAGRPHPANFPEKPPPCNGSTTSSPSSASSVEARSQHHEAAQHLASIPQLKAAIKELQGKLQRSGLSDNPATEAERKIKSRYAKFRQRRQPDMREGNSDRRAAGASSNTPATIRTRWAPGAPAQVARGVHVGRRLLRLENLDHRRDRRPTSASNCRAMAPFTVLKAKTPLRPARSSTAR